MRKFRALFTVSTSKITESTTLIYNLIISTVKRKIISLKGKELLKTQNNNT
jgi:hypothetical protein